MSGARRAREELEAQVAALEGSSERLDRLEGRLGHLADRVDTIQQVTGYIVENSGALEEVYKSAEATRRFSTLKDSVPGVLLAEIAERLKLRFPPTEADVREAVERISVGGDAARAAQVAHDRARLAEAARQADGPAERPPRAVPSAEEIKAAFYELCVVLSPSETVRLDPHLGSWEGDEWVRKPACFKLSMRFGERAFRMATAIRSVLEPALVEANHGAAPNEKGVVLWVGKTRKQLASKRARRDGGKGGAEAAQGGEHPVGAGAAAADGDAAAAAAAAAGAPAGGAAGKGGQEKGKGKGKKGGKAKGKGEKGGKGKKGGRAGPKGGR